MAANWYRACDIAKSISLSGHLRSLYSCAAVLHLSFVVAAAASAYAFLKWSRLSRIARTRVWRLYVGVTKRAMLHVDLVFRNKCADTAPFLASCLPAAALELQGSRTPNLPTPPHKHLTDSSDTLATQATLCSNSLPYTIPSLSTTRVASFLWYLNPIQRWLPSTSSTLCISSA
jgi:hypothetical protein